MESGLEDRNNEARVKTELAPKARLNGVRPRRPEQSRPEVTTPPLCVTSQWSPA